MLLCTVLLPYKSLADLFMHVQAMNCERVALAVNHEHTLANLDKALRENISLQSIMLNQAQQVCILTFSQSSIAIDFLVRRIAISERSKPLELSLHVAACLGASGTSLSSSVHAFSFQKVVLYRLVRSAQHRKL